MILNIMSQIFYASSIKFGDIFPPKNHPIYFEYL